MLDHLLEVMYKDASARNIRNEMAQGLKNLPVEELRKLASGELKLADYDNDHWLCKFKDTPFYDEALELETHSIELEAQQQKMSLEDNEERRARQDARSALWDAQDALRLKKRMLELDMRKAELSAVTGEPEESAMEELEESPEEEAAEEVPEDEEKAAAVDYLLNRHRHEVMAKFAGSLKRLDRVGQALGKLQGKHSAQEIHDSPALMAKFKNLRKAYNTAANKSDYRLSHGGDVEGLAGKVKSGSASLAFGLAKVAAASGDEELLKIALDMMTPEQIEMLKEAGFFDAVKGVAGKARGAIQNMGAGGAARRMAAAGAEHDELARGARMVDKAFAGPSALKANELQLSHKNLMQHIANTPEQVASRQVAQHVARLNAPPALRANELQIGAANLNRPGMMDRLRGMVPQMPMMQPAMAKASSVSPEVLASMRFAAAFEKDAGMGGAIMEGLGGAAKFIGAGLKGVGRVGAKQGFEAGLQSAGRVATRGVQKAGQWAAQNPGAAAAIGGTALGTGVAGAGALGFGAGRATAN